MGVLVRCRDWFKGLATGQKVLVILGCLFLLGLPATLSGSGQIEDPTVAETITETQAVETVEVTGSDQPAQTTTTAQPNPEPKPTEPAVIVAEPEPDVDEALEAEVSQFIVDTGAASITIQTSSACDEDTLLLMADWINKASASVRRFTALLESGTPSQIATIQANYTTISTMMNELNSNAETHLSYCQTLLGL